MVAAILIALCLATSASAQGAQVNLPGGAKVEYRFDFNGSGIVRIGFKSPGATNVVMSVYSPAQVAQLQRGEQPPPMGRGSPSRDYELYWQGSPREGGTYRIVIENRNNFAINFRLDVSGEGVTSVAQIGYAFLQSPTNVISEGGKSYLVIDLPKNLGLEPLRLQIPPKPEMCTKPNQIPPVITQSIKLCHGETYPPLRIVGKNIALFGDELRTAVVTSSGRQFAITAEGSNIWIDGVVINARADPQDVNAWMCLYDECQFQTSRGIVTLRGGIRYGGGILLRATDSTVRNVTVRGGTIGIATVDGRNNYILDNELNGLNAWGSFNVNSVASYFVNNQLHRNNHGCTTPDGRRFLSGCETAGWVCISCAGNHIIGNKCELSGNCYYMSGERGLASNENRFIGNYCAGASDNCFEITFSLNNLLANNIATIEPKTNTPCKYPFWIGGSTVFFQNNRWECAISADDAFNQSRDSTVVGTMITNLDAFGRVPIAPAPQVTSVPTVSPITGRVSATRMPLMLRFPRGDVLELVE
ncbi:MAG: hypothetical protein N2559_13245, partial [Anaerolineae bacterium]|nr:hypothetical protein [Anaerolineae bacterium]